MSQRSNVAPAQRKKNGFSAYMRQNAWLYIFLIPGMVFLFIMNYLPMFGIVIAFKDFRVVKGIMGSPWVGLKHFEYLFHAPDFWRILRNSIVLSLMRLICGFPMPIILALMMNEMGSQGYKRTMQTILYLPHFISWVVAASLIFSILNSEGLLNKLLMQLGLIKKNVNWLSVGEYFWPILTVSNIWKSVGFSSIMYLSAIAGIDGELYQAGAVDGLNRMGMIWHVTLPGIRTTIVLLGILQIGSLLNAGFQQQLLLGNDMTRDFFEVIDTFSYKYGIQNGNYSYGTAVGLMKSIISVILVFSANALSRKAMDVAVL